MKKLSLLSSLAACLSLSFSAFAAEKPGHDHGEEGHDHDHGHEHATPGPNGGKVLAEIEPHFELFVLADRTVSLTPLTEDLKAAPLAGATAKLTGGDRANPTSLTFVEKDGALVSETPLPAGDEIPVIIRITPKTDAEAVTVRMKLNLAECAECKKPEYACVCEHSHEGHDHDHGHDHKEGDGHAH